MDVAVIQVGVSSRVRREHQRHRAGTTGAHMLVAAQGSGTASTHRSFPRRAATTPRDVEGAARTESDTVPVPARGTSGFAVKLDDRSDRAIGSGERVVMRVSVTIVLVARGQPKGALPARDAAVLRRRRAVLAEITGRPSRR